MGRPMILKQRRRRRFAGASSRAGVRRYFYDIHVSSNAPIAGEALQQIGQLFDVERTVMGLPPEQRRRVRQSAARPLIDDLAAFLDASLAMISGRGVHAIGAGSVAQAEADPSADKQNTLRTTECLLEELTQMAPRAGLIYPSSAAVYGIVAAGPIGEDAPTKPISVYGANKLAAEQLCRGFAKVSGRDSVVCAILFRIRAAAAQIVALGGRTAAARRRT
jgi:nucleoside-diphosphate-sugar epimerase